MEPYEIRQLPDVNAVLITVYETWNTGRDAGSAIEHLLQIIDESPDPIYYLSDVTQAQFKIEDLAQIANLLTSGNKIVQHHNLKGIIAISPSKLIELATKGMNTATFGNVNIKVFATLDEAMDYMR